jgi:predicted nucleic acid-binding protein
VTDAVVYLDSSALLKLILDEPETDALVAFLQRWPNRVSSALARVEVGRIVGRVQDAAAAREARHVLRQVHIVRIDDTIVASAAELDPIGLRSLDAIHLATARIFGAELAGMVCYDRRLAAACREHGITVWAP